MKLMILDGNSIINRAFYGVRLLTTRDGLYTNAIFGFLNILEKLRNEEQPDALAVAFDLKAPTFRHLQYDGYKATRHAMPEELAQQMPLMKEVLRAMRIPIFECEGWEADDILGTAGKLCAAKDWDCVIVTGDRDSLQLVAPHVSVKLVITKGGQTGSTLYTPDVFEAEYGFAPIHMIDLKSLMGDSSDNIPGVAGIGPKTATQLLVQYGTLDGVYAHLEELKDSVRKKLEAGRENAYRSYDLATIRCEAPVAFEPEACRVQDVDNDALWELFQKLEFTRLASRYQLHPPKPAEPEVCEGTCEPVIVETAEHAEAFLKQFAEKPYVAVLFAPGFDAVSVLLDDGSAAYYFSRERLGEAYETVLCGLCSGSIRKVTHDLKEVMRHLLECGLPIEGFCFDTALAGYLLDATQGSYEIDRLFMQYCASKVGLADEKELGEAAAISNLSARTAAIAALYEVLPKKLESEGMQELYYEMELPLCAVLARMETAGVLADQMALVAFGNMLSERIADCQALIFEYAGGELNINSPKQLGELLFEKLGLPAVKRTKSGYSTNADVLEKLKNKHPIIQAILDYRMLAKLKSTYADGLVKEIAEDGRIHTTFQNTVTATGRLSSTEPNLQNIPVRTELGSEIRKMFIPADGCVFIDADYSQIELRVLAHIADDAHMQAAFRSGMDIHTATAAQVFGVAPDEVTPLQRRHAKAVNFGIVYGISEFSLAEDIGVTRKEAKAYIDSYLENYSGVRNYMHEIVRKAKENGYVTTLFGRKRELPELKSNNFNIRSFGERVALNSPIQGTAADIIKLAMLHVDTALRNAGLRGRLILQVHDELIVECPVEEAETVKTLVKEQMEHVMELSVPLLAEANVGESWYDAK